MNPLIQGLFKQFREEEELLQLSDADAFELFSASLLLSDDLLAQVETTDLLLDASTLGIDVAVLDVNGQVMWDVQDVDDLCETSKRLDVALHLIQAKRSASVSSSEILSFGDAAKKVLNNTGISGHPRLAAVAAALRSLFDNHAASLKAPPAVYLEFATTAPPGSTRDPIVVERAEAVASDIRALGFVGRVSVAVRGADDLHDAWVRKNHANEVEIQLEKQVNLPKMPGIDQAILGVVSVQELLKLVHSTDGSLDERVFYDNVRGFKGRDNSVNRQIIETLGSEERTLLPVLNNGVTVVASSYAPKPGDSVALSGFQIVNGCQTSHCLHLAQESLGDATDAVYVPIRIVITEDEDVATRIIRATNSQTEVGENDLVALTRFQKKLEDFYRLDSADVKLTYERRSGQFYEKDVTKTRVLTISDQMRAVSAMFLDLPHAAARYTQRLYSEVGESIFRDDHKLLPYVASAFAAYRLENAFRTGLDPALKPVRYHILMTYKYQLFGKSSSPLQSPKAEDEAKQIIDALKGPEQLNLFREAAQKVVVTAGGSLPTSDRLKRQGFSQELVRTLASSTT